MIALLGTDHDGAIAQQITEELGVEISTSAVQKKRKSLAIPSFPTNRIVNRQGKTAYICSESLGDSIKHLRYRNRLSQKQLAVKLGCCSRTIWKLENDKLSQKFASELLEKIKTDKRSKNGLTDL